MSGAAPTVAHLLSSFGMGGQERVAADLAAGQIAAGWRVLAVSLAADGDAELARELAGRGAEVRSVPKRSGFDFTLTARLAWLLARERVDVVHSHNPQPLIYGAPAARLARARAIHTKHGQNPLDGRQLALVRAAARLTSAYVAVSPVTAEVARARREAPASRLRTIENGIDLARFRPDVAARAEVRRSLGIADDAWLIGTVGRLAPEKNQALLLEALAPHLSSQIQVALIGDGPEAASLRAQAARLAGGRFVHFAGARPDVPRWLAALDCFALSSRSEGLPLVIPEAMASALPVVSTRVGGIGDVVAEGETGFLVASGDAPALGDRLARLATERKLAASFGAHGRALALARYSAERMVREYLALYRD
jgi:glycosyltransferase involved in cell wall biosynthesis